MKQLLELLRRKAPKSSSAMPQYYRRALTTSEFVLIVYFVMVAALFSWINHRLEWFPLLAAACMAGCRYAIGRANSRKAVYAFELVIILWCAWNTRNVGWGCGTQHLLIPMLMFCFFNVYEPTGLKLLGFLLTVGYRIALFGHTLENDPVFTLSNTLTIIYQTLNTVVLFDILAISFITFSSSIQENERQLLLNNQELHKEAGTDPLTQLPNRRAIMDVIEDYLKKNPSEPFSVAIADIDFFKKVNDTYGHNCGDYTLKELSRLFLSAAEGKYQVCRWGGEEFCFFLPGMNLDQAGTEMQELNLRVKRMPLHFDTIDYTITITIGVEENDYHSSMLEILDRADRKLYMGKVRGRDQVVI